jgi:5'-methylthioadenosine phosphorylase
VREIGLHFPGKSLAPALQGRHNNAMSEARIGIIGGTGLYEMEGLTDRRWVRVRTPFGDPSDALLTGTLEGRPVVFLPRHGRGHRWLPGELNHRANIWALKKLGVAWILSVSAVGSLQGRYRPCDLVLVDQFVDRTKKGPEHTFFGRGIVAHVAFAHPVCEDLRRIVLAEARAAGVRVHDGGAYVCIEGPAFSTRAESLTHHRLGYDVVGMTNLGEARCAREAEIAYVTLAFVTDLDAWSEAHEHVTVQMVVSNLKRNAETARMLIRRVIPRIPAEPGCSCHQALEHAIMTERSLWPAATVRRLRPILGRFLGKG